MNREAAAKRVTDMINEEKGKKFLKASCMSSDRKGIFFRYATGVREETYFDLASISKNVVLSMLLHHATLKGIDPKKSYCQIFSEHAVNKETIGRLSEKSLKRLSNISLEDILLHRSGIMEWYPFYCGGDFIDTMNMVLSETEPVEGMVYSDIGFMLVGMLVEAISGNSLSDELSSLNEALGTGFMYNPPACTECVETEMGNQVEMGMCRERNLNFSPLAGVRDGWRPTDTPIRGSVNDGNCYYAMGGVSGHAGVFGRITDLISLGDMYLSGDDKYISRELKKYALTPLKDGRTPGFDAGEVFAPGVGHTGFTGTAFYMNPATGICSVLLTNRLMIEGPPDIQDFRRKVFALLDADREV